MKLINKIFRIPDLEAARQQLQELEKENEMLLNRIAERQKQLSEVDLNKTIDMIKELEQFVKEHQN